MRLKLLVLIRHFLFKLRYGLRSEHGEHIREQIKHFREVGTATRCKVCGLSIRGPLGWTNRAIWGVAPNLKHPDLCSA